MRKLNLIFLCVLCAICGSSRFSTAQEAVDDADMEPASPSRRPKPKPRKTSNQQLETWHTLTMEGAAFLGELKYQAGDLSDAHHTFRDSLKSSTNIDNPGASVMALDLYRMAELAVRRGDLASAKRHLEILIHRYPDTDMAKRGASLLAAISRGRPDAPPKDDAVEPLGETDQPESELREIQRALKENRFQQALALCSDFRRRFPGHAAVAELRLLEGALYLMADDPAQARDILDALVRQLKGPLRGKAVYLLGAASLELGDLRGIMEAVPDADAERSGEKWIALAQVWRAAALAREGQDLKAMTKYRNLLNSHFASPVKAYARAALGALEDRQGRPREALRTLDEAAREAAGFGLSDLAAAARLSRAHLLYKLRRFEEAGAAYASFVSSFPGHSKLSLALYQRGLCLRRTGRQKAARGTFEELVRLYPDSPDAPNAHLQLGQLYAKSGETSKAVDHYRRMGLKGGSEAESTLLMAQVHYNNKRYKQAIPLYEKFLAELSPGAPADDPRAHEVQHLLLTSYWMGDRDNPDMLRAASLYPHHAIVAHIQWEGGAKAYRAGNYRLAEQSFREFAERFPKSSHRAESLFFRADCLAKLGDSRGAASAYREFLRRYPKHAQAEQGRFNLASALYDSGQYQASANAYGATLGPDAAFNRALALGMAGKKAGALAAYLELAKRYPKHPKAAWVWLQVGELHESMGRLRQAIQAYARAETSPRVLFNVARCHERLNSAVPARRSYEKLLAARPARDPFRLHGLVRLGLLYEIDGRSRQAARLYAEVIKLGAPGEVYEMARKRLQALGQQGDLTSR